MVEKNAKLLPQFAEKGHFNLSKLQCEGSTEEYVWKQFADKKPCYHKSCYLKYNQKNLYRLFSRSSEKKTKSEESDMPLVTSLIRIDRT